MMSKEECRPQINAILENIREQLADDTNLYKVDCWNGIKQNEVRFVGILNQVKGFAFTDINCTLSEVLNEPNEVADFFVNDWKNHTMDDIKSFMRFISDGQKWGWD